MVGEDILVFRWLRKTLLPSPEDLERRKQELRR